MGVQDEYVEKIRPAVAGHIANTEPNRLISRSVEDVAGIGFGRVVKDGSADGLCTGVLTTLDEFNFLGITVRDRSVRVETPDMFAQRESARIMRSGVIWVAVAGAVQRGTDVTVNTTTGALSSTAVGAGQVLIPRARWDSTTTGAGLAKLRLG